MWGEEMMLQRAGATAKKARPSGSHQVKFLSCIFVECHPESQSLSWADLQLHKINKPKEKKLRDETVVKVTRALATGHVSVHNIWRGTSQCNEKALSHV